MSRPGNTPQAQRAIAFLRAINVGGRTVGMDRLRALFLSLGFSNVETFIASGNVIFDTESADTRLLESEIQRRLQAALGYEVATFIRTPAELAAIAAHRAFPTAATEAEGASVYVGFLQRRPGPEARKKLMACRSEEDDLQVHRREVYWLCRTRLSDSAFSGMLLERMLGMPATLRSMTTVTRLVAKYAMAPEAP